MTSWKQWARFFTPSPSERQAITHVACSDTSPQADSRGRRNDCKSRIHCLHRDVAPPSFVAPGKLRALARPHVQHVLVGTHVCMSFNALPLSNLYVSSLTTNEDVGRLQMIRLAYLPQHRRRSVGTEGDDGSKRVGIGRVLALHRLYGRCRLA